MWAQPLIDLLKLHPETSIVLSTPWVRHLGFSHTNAALPELLRERVIGSTWHLTISSSLRGVIPDCEDWYDAATRYEQIARSVVHDNLASGDWIAIDHTVQGWPQEMQHHLVKVDRKKGLSCPVSLAELKKRLAENYIVHTAPGSNINFRAPEQLEASLEV